MKKFLSLIVVGMLILSVMAGCATEKESNEENNDVVVNQSDENQVADEKVEESENKDNISNKEESESKPQESVKPENNTDKKEEEKNITLSEVVKEMIKVIPKDEHTLEEIPQELYKDVYGVNSADFKDVKIYGTMISVKANEIIVIKAENSKELDKAVSVLNQRKDTVYKTWEKYLPDQFEMVKKGVIKTNGNYAALIISPEVDKVANKFIELTK